MSESKSKLPSHKDGSPLGLWFTAILIGVLFGSGLGFLKARFGQQSRALHAHQDSELISERDLLSEPNAHSYSKFLTHRFSKPTLPADHVVTRAIAEEWLVKDPVSCLNYLRTEGKLGLVNSPLIKRAVKGMLTRGLGFTIGAAKNIESSLLRDEVLSIAFREVASSDPKSTIAFLTEIPQHQRADIYTVIAAGLAERDGAKGLNYVLGVSGMPDDFVMIAAKKALTKDPLESARAIMESERLSLALRPSAADLRAKLLDNIFYARDIDLPSKRTLFSQLPPGNVRDVYVTEVLGAYLVTAPGEVEVLAAEIKNPALRDRMLSRAAIEMQPGDVLKVTDHISNPSARLQVLRSVAMRFASSSPESTISWASGIPDPLVQTDVLRCVMATWMVKAPDAAIQYAMKQIETGSTLSFGVVLPDLLGQFAENPLRGTDRIDMSKMATLPPDVRRNLVTLMRAQLRPSQWEKLAPFLK